MRRASTTLSGSSHHKIEAGRRLVQLEDARLAELDLSTQGRRRLALGRRDQLLVHVDAEHRLRRGRDTPDEPAVSAADVEHAHALEIDNPRQRLELAALRVDRHRHRGIVVLYLAA